jgi:hypothetical protein
MHFFTAPSGKNNHSSYGSKTRFYQIWKSGRGRAVELMGIESTEHGLAVVQYDPAVSLACAKASIEPLVGRLGVVVILGGG